MYISWFVFANLCLSVGICLSLCHCLTGPVPTLPSLYPLVSGVVFIFGHFSSPRFNQLHNVMMIPHQSLVKFPHLLTVMISRSSHLLSPAFLLSLFLPLSSSSTPSFFLILILSHPTLISRSIDSILLLLLLLLLSHPTLISRLFNSLHLFSRFLWSSWNSGINSSKLSIRRFTIHWRPATLLSPHSPGNSVTRDLPRKSPASTTRPTETFSRRFEAW